jgi:hypothetical protein
VSGQAASASTDPVERALARAHGVLPDQGPIGVFIHHNTLHAFQHRPFHDAVVAGADALQARPYLSLAEFRAAIRSGRVADADLYHEIDVALGDRGGLEVAPSLDARTLWHELIAGHGDTDDEAGLEFTVRAGIAPVCKDLALWEAAADRASRAPRRTVPYGQHLRRHRDAVVALGGADTDPSVHGELVRLGSAFLDHGQAHAALPGRAQGFLRSVSGLYVDGESAPRDCRGAESDMRRIHAVGASARSVIDENLAALGVDEEDREAYLFATALALPGWAGMFSRLEGHPDDHPGGPPATLIDFLAVRLVLERHAVANACRAARLDPRWNVLRETALTPVPRPPLLDASVLWALGRRAGWSPAEIRALDDHTLDRLWHACAECADLVRRRVCQNAFERTYRRMVLDALAARRELPPHAVDGRPRAQFVFCIDEREESMRRALEEQHPNYVTYGAAGFFGVAIDYLGLYDQAPAAYCPVVVTPAHEVHERPVPSDLSWHALRLRLRDAWHTFERRAAAASRTLTGGAGMSFLAGPLSGLATLLHLVAPRSKPLFDEHVTSRVAPRPTTRLSALRDDTAPQTTHKPLGFSLDETADRVAALLTNIGLVRDFAPVVVILGHGSTSLNNPHESAHDCGACGGRRGGANARLFADMANRPDVRAGVRARGIDIPDDTWFVGALHDTASDAVVYYDLDAVPAGAWRAFDEASGALELARRENARERSRRFDNAPLTIDPVRALRHVEERSSSLAQPRPEYGHCTNSICIVGRRELTRGVHLDRRAFLVSYDPTIDRDDKVLERILAAVGPVGAGISLEYYFSSVDNEVYGCGTKLPHNVTGLIGVMNGHQSDLRTGLPLQMVEIHEPMRLLVIVDASPEALLTVASRQAEVAELVVNEWVQLVSIHPVTGAMAVFEQGQFVPYEPTPTLLPVVERSAEWHMRTREHVTAALVRSALPPTVVGPGHGAADGRARAEMLP